MIHDFITFEDNSAPHKSTTSRLIGKMTLTKKSAKPPHHDSFSDLASLMRVKKLYSPISTPSPPSQPLTVAPNGPRFASRIQPGSSILSPLARSFQAPESVASFLQEQELAAPTLVASEPIPEYRPENMRPFETMAGAINNYNSDEDSECDRHHRRRTPSPLYMQPLLIPGLELPAGVGPAQPLTPTESLHDSPSGFRSDQETVVRVTKHTWDALDKELNTIRKQKLELENRLSALETSNAVLRDVDHDIGVRLGKLKYQNEANKAQKAAMGRTLSEKEMKIKIQQLEIDELVGQIKTKEDELDRATRQLAGTKAKSAELNLNTGSSDLTYLLSLKHKRALSDLAANKDRTFSNWAMTKDCELEDLNQKIKEQERELNKVTHERDEASRAQANSGDHLNRARNLADTLAQREKLITDLRHQVLTEQFKVTELEDELEATQAKSNLADIDDVKSKLREKTSICDRQRSQLKMTELQLAQSQSRLMKITNHGESLHGAAHVVKPAQTSKLPKLVISCVECYNKNLPCDNGAKCRNCIENDTSCARWRCSLKHKYGDCPLTPCPLSHDSQGWLVLRTERPEW
ncbi:hypothetical protein G6011_04423 [Alternaria panax]|uniref:Uncharacterized protein n=1 Tax=Alternaria panax TaxID=48097 RepID=A0AAD4IGI0_9PLEO|nr:hypothetical protein G6011_04423 [Alternaria panax]